MDSVRERHREVHGMCQDDGKIKMSVDECDVIRSRVFNFYSVQSIIISKLKKTLVKELKYVNIK